MEKFAPINVEFSLRDVGSKVFDQLTADIYTGAGSIVRELVKNAYDGYLALDAEASDDESPPREIVISRERDKDGVGRILLADRGIGQDLGKIKGNVQISISTKPEELEDPTGFRGLGSWAVLGGGSKIIITSSKKGTADEYRLEINVRKIYEICDTTTTAHDILNNTKCISFLKRPCGKDDHFTTVEVICDGPPEIVNEHELNRLYPYTDPHNPDLRDLLVRHCPIPFSSEGGVYEKIHEIYRQGRYVPTGIVLDGDKLERRLPAELSAFSKHEIRLGKHIAAIAWVVENPDKTGEAGRWIDEQKHFLGGPSIQVVKYNVPIGRKGLFSDDIVRAGILDWFVGEVHILAVDVRPSANGEELRAGTARDTFVEELQEFYRKLEKSAESKSEVLSLRKKLHQGMEAAAQLANATHEKERDDPHTLAKIATAVGLIEQIDKKGKPKTESERKVREAAQQPQVMRFLKQTRDTLKEGGWAERYKKSDKPAEDDKSRGKSAGKRQPATAGEGGARMIAVDEFQARIGRAIPRFEQLGLTPVQVEGVLKIIRDLLNA